MSIGIFLVVDGIDGAGKTTLIKGLGEWFNELLRVHEIAKQVHTVRDPGSTMFGEQMRSVLKSTNQQEPLDPVAEFLAFSASRAQLVARKIKPAVESGDIILSDRFAASTYAYQGYLREMLAKLGTKLTLGTIQVGMQNVEPALTLWLNTPPEIAKERATRTHAPGDVFDEMGLDVYKLLATAFEEACGTKRGEDSPLSILGPTAVLDGTLSQADVLSQAKAIIKKTDFFKSYFLDA